MLWEASWSDECDHNRAGYWIMKETSEWLWELQHQELINLLSWHMGVTHLTWHGVCALSSWGFCKKVASHLLVQGEWSHGQLPGLPLILGTLFRAWEWTRQPLHGVPLLHGGEEICQHWSLPVIGYIWKCFTVSLAQSYSKQQDIFFRRMGKSWQSNHW